MAPIWGMNGLEGVIQNKSPAQFYHPSAFEGTSSALPRVQSRRIPKEPCSSSLPSYGFLYHLNIFASGLLSFLKLQVRDVLLREKKLENFKATSQNFFSYNGNSKL